MPGMGVAHGLNIGAPCVWKLLSEVEAGFSQQAEPLDRLLGPGGGRASGGLAS